MALSATIKSLQDTMRKADDPEVLLKEYEQAVAAAAEIRAKLKAELAAALEGQSPARA